MEIACVVANGFEDSELFVPLARLSAAGHHVRIIGTRAGEDLVGKKGRHITVEHSIDDVSADDYHALLIPGGHSPDELRGDPRFVDLAKAFDHQRKLIAAICHGPQLLLTARLVYGRELTAWPTVQGDLALAHAQVRDEECVMDENLITSRMPQDLEAFCYAIIKYLSHRDSHYLKAGRVMAPAAAH